jgi:hypothetical protein
MVTQGTLRIIDTVDTQGGGGACSVPMDAAVGAPATPCQRCGTYAWLSPTGGMELCDACIARAQSEEITFGAVTGSALRTLLRVGLPCAMLLVAVEVPLAIAELRMDLPSAAGHIHALTFGVWAAGVVQLVAVRALRGEPLRFGGAAGEALRCLPSMFTTTILANITIVLFLLLLIVPGVLRALSYAVVIPIVLIEGRSGLDAMRTSAARMWGVRGAAFGAYLVSCIPMLVIFLLAVLAYAMGEVVDEGGGAVDARGLEKRIDAGISLGVAACMPFVYCVSATLYERTRHRGGTWL